MTRVVIGTCPATVIRLARSSVLRKSRMQCGTLRWAGMMGLLAALAVPAAFAIVATAELGFTTQVSARLISILQQRFGASARNRLSGWIGFAREQKKAAFGEQRLAAHGRDTETLQLVNDLVNRIPFIDDRIHWQQGDYWATPAESVASNGGDCEDFAIGKYYMLKELGVPIGRLRITYVRVLKRNQAHMVLAYYASPGADPLILDNLENRVRVASARTDLEPVYSFNDDEVQIIEGGRKGPPSQIRAWLALQEKLLAESQL